MPEAIIVFPSQCENGHRLRGTESESLVGCVEPDCENFVSEQELDAAIAEGSES